MGVGVELERSYSIDAGGQNAQIDYVTYDGIGFVDFTNDIRVLWDGRAVESEKH